MTGMLASVSNLDEARMALEEGVDILDLKDPAHGALGAVTTETATEIVSLVDKKCLVSATIGDLPMQATLIGQAISAMAATGVDIIKIGVFNELTEDVISILKEQAIKGAQASEGLHFTIVLVFFVDKDIKIDGLPELAKAGIRGVMLDTADKTNGNLRSYTQEDDIKAFVESTQSYGLLAGLAGSLKAEDVGPLLKYGPDYLGFRGALCENNSRTESLNSDAIRGIKQLLTKPIDGFELNTANK